MENQISKEFTFMSLIQFALPTIGMMIFSAMYTIVDGIFVSRLVGTDALSSVNITYPCISIMMGIAIMFSSGGSAVVATKLGEGKPKQAYQNFTLITITALIVSIIVSILGLIFIDDLISILGAKGAMIEHSKVYLKILLVFAPASVLQILFQSFYVVSGKPGIGLSVSLFSGVLNGILDYLFMGPMDMGIAGAAYATASGYVVAAFVGIIFFSMKKQSIHFSKPDLDFAVIKETCFNGSSEMVTSIATSVITFLFNLTMMKYLGSDGVAAITIILYCEFLLSALYIGFSIGVAPILSYNYGDQNYDRLKKIYKMNRNFILFTSGIVFLTALVLAPIITNIFVDKTNPVYAIAKHGFYLFSFSFLFSGMNIYSSAFFTALSNGKVSAIIAFSRTFIFFIFAITMLPKVLEVNGVWLAVPFAEIMTLLLVSKYLKKYSNIIK